MNKQVTKFGDTHSRGTMVVLMVKNPPARAGDMGSIPGLGRFPREGNGNPLQYSCLENPMDRGAWRASVHGVTKSRKRLSDFTHTLTCAGAHGVKMGYSWSFPMHICPD